MTFEELMWIVRKLQEQQREIEERIRRDRGIYDPILKRWVGLPGPHDN